MKKLFIIIFLINLSSIAKSNTEIEIDQNHNETLTEIYLHELKVIWSNIYLKKLKIQNKEIDELQIIGEYAEIVNNEELFYSLGVVYMNIPDSYKAYKWMSLAAKYNHPHAHHNIGWWYDHGFEHIKIDKAKAIEYYNKAFWELDVARSGGRLSEIYLSGDGVEKDEVKARKILEWILEAPELYVDDNDILLAEYKLGEIYRYSIGVEQDLNKAVGYFIEAAIKGDDSAMVEAGQIYRIWYRERKEESDNQMAESLYLKAAEKGNTEAMVYLSAIYNEKLVNEKDRAINEVKYISWLYTAYKIGVTHEDLKKMVNQFVETTILNDKKFLEELDKYTEVCIKKKFKNCFSS